MQKKILIAGIVGLVAGLAVGFFGANAINRGAVEVRGPVAEGTPGIVIPDGLQTGEQGTAAAPNGGMTANVAETLDKAAAEPMNFEAQMKAGDMYRQIGQMDKAIEFYLIGVGLVPDNREANIVLANSYFDTKQFESAEYYYAKALELDPNDINARTDLGTTFVERQPPDFDRAIAEFEKSLAIDPKHEPTLYNLGVAYFRKGDVENAKAMLGRLEEINRTTLMASKLREHLFPK